MVVMMMPAVFVVPIGVTRPAAFVLPAFRKGNAAADKNHEGNDPVVVVDFQGMIDYAKQK
jgi:hypothetical protein